MPSLQKIQKIIEVEFLEWSNAHPPGTLLITFRDDPSLTPLIVVSIDHNGDIQLFDSKLEKLILRNYEWLNHHYK